MHVLSVVSVLVVVVVASGASSRQQCHLRELDLCMAMGAGTNKVPVTDEELDKQCGVLTEVTDCFNWYLQNCATSIQRELIGLVTEGASRVQKSYCTRGELLRGEFMKHAPCLAKFPTLGSNCTEDFKAGVQTMEKAKFSDRISTFCCVYTRYNDCAVNIVESTCGAEAVEYGNIFVRLLASNLPNAVCQGFSNNPLCDNLLPPPGTKSDPHSRGIVSRLFSAYLI